MNRFLWWCVFIGVCAAVVLALGVLLRAPQVACVASIVLLVAGAPVAVVAVCDLWASRPWRK